MNAKGIKRIGMSDANNRGWHRIRFVIEAQKPDWCCDTEQIIGQTLHMYLIEEQAAKCKTGKQEQTIDNNFAHPRWTVQVEHVGNLVLIESEETANREASYPMGKGVVVEVA